MKMMNFPAPAIVQLKSIIKVNLSVLIVVTTGITGDAMPDSAANDRTGATVQTISGASAARKQKLDRETAAAVSEIPGVAVKEKDLQTPALPPIEGFHPIKRLLRPLEQLQAQSIQLQQQIMRLEGPIASLQPPMLGLRDRMKVVERALSGINDQMIHVEQRVGGAQSEMTRVRQDITGMRADLSAMRSEIGQLKRPIEQIQKPLLGIAGPLTAVQDRLTQMETLLATVLLAIIVSAGLIAVGTPIAAILILKNRRKLFPDLRDDELALRKDSQRVATTSSRM